MKPCPFCKSNNVEVVYTQETDIHQVACKNCYARGPDVDELNVFDEVAAQLAIDRWNQARR